MFFQFLVILSLADSRIWIIIFLIGLGYCLISSDSSANDSFMGMEICVTAESKRNMEVQYY